MSKIINFPVITLKAVISIWMPQNIFLKMTTLQKKSFSLSAGSAEEKELNLRHQYREHRRQLNRALTFTPQKWDSKNLPNAK